MKTLPLFFIIFFSLQVSTNAETYPDSLKTVLAKASHDSIRMQALDPLVKYYFGQDLDTALYYAMQSLEVAKRLENPQFRPVAYNFVATILQYQEKYEQSLEYYFEGLRFSDSIEFTRYSALLSGNIGLLYSKENENEKAIPYLQKSMKLSKEINYEQGVANSLTYLGLSFYNLDNYDSAKVYFLESMERYRELEDLDGVSNCINNLGAIEFELGNFDKALQYYKESFTIVENDASDSTFYLQNVGGVFREKGKLDSAQLYFQKGLEIAQRMESFNRQATFYEELVSVSKLKGQYKLATSYFEQWMIAKDSINERLNNDRVADMEVKYDTQEKEKALVQKELEVERQKSLRNRVFWIGLFSILFLLFLIQLLRSRQRLRQQEAALALKLEKAEAEKLREMDKIKSNFFANISHEFRTPLTLILSPLEQFLKGTFKGDRNKYYRIMIRNSKRLLALVNQLLELSRLESGKMQLQLTKKDINQFIRVVIYSFESIAERKQIVYEVDLQEINREVYYDADKLEKILVNLLSNAFKFTPEEGWIRIKARFEEIDLSPYLKISIQDNGIGIPKEEIEHIFDRFYQVQTSDMGAGSSGIGLALAKELTLLHKGEINVESEEGNGTHFQLSICLDHRLLQPGQILSEELIERVSDKSSMVRDQAKMNKPEPQNLDQYISKKPIVLVVEDNPDVSTFIKDQLEENYQIIQAENGKIGFGLALEQTPDLILSDVMMPEMDGIELCNRLKTDQRTSHIPLILLTAKATQGDKLEGLRTGADDYLTKPFHSDELNLRINNLIEKGNKLRAFYSQKERFKPTEVTVNSIDEQFLTKVQELIEDNMEEDQFSVVELSEKLNMSRSQLHRKLKSLTGRGPNQIIRDMRLLRAKELLAKGAGNATEVAFSVGFSSGAYFSKCFSDAFGMTPTEAMKQI